MSARKHVYVYECLCLDLCMYICLCVLQKRATPACRSARMFACICICACRHVCVYTNICMYVCLLVHTSEERHLHLSVYQSVCLFVCLSVCIYISQHTSHWYLRWFASNNLQKFKSDYIFDRPHMCQFIQLTIHRVCKSVWQFHTKEQIW